MILVGVVFARRRKQEGVGAAREGGGGCSIFFGGEGLIVSQSSECGCRMLKEARGCWVRTKEGRGGVVGGVRFYPSRDA